MLRKITLVSLLLISTGAMAQVANDPIRQAFWHDSSGKPILDRHGNCIRTGSYLRLGSPNCRPSQATAPPAATTSDTEQEQVTEVPEATITSTTAADTAEQQAPAQPKAASNTTAASPAPAPTPTVTADTSKVEVITYSYPVTSIGTHIYFDFDKNNLRIAEQEKLEEVVIAARQAHKIVKVSVEGHADSRGTDAYNYDLSQRRINTVVNYLNLRGIDTHSTMAWGESKLIYFADGRENYDHSRRAEVTVKIMHKVKD